MLRDDATKEEIEQWQHENPMDYLKAVDLITTASNRDEVFRAIYDIANWYIPDRLHKYYSLAEESTENEARLNEAKFQTLAAKKIFTAPPSAMNDPFDGRGFYYRTDEVIAAMRNPDLTEVSFDFSSMVRFSSLTGAGSGSLPMWAHYANNHRGYCVGYNMKEGNNQLRGTTFPVQYLDHRVDITDIMVRQMQAITKRAEECIARGEKRVSIDDLTLIYIPLLLENMKDSFWSYEQEFRCSIGEGGPSVPYVNAVPDEIFVGLNCAAEHQDRLVEIGTNMAIPVWKMTYEEQSPGYELKPIRIA